MSKYTPGKWWVAHAYPSIGGKMVCAPSQTESSPYTVVATYIENQADTCLIAAAPEMYELLREYYESAHPGNGSNLFGRTKKLLKRID